MMSSERLAISGFRDVFVETSQPITNLPKQKIFFWRFFAALLIGLAAILAWPKQSAFELSLSPDNLLNLVNQDRAVQGLKAFKMNSGLTRAAYQKAEHMLKNSYFSHTSPRGLTPWDFIKEQNFQYSFAGENLAMNYTSSYELQKDFLESPSHRENLLSPLYSDVGIAVVEGKFQGQGVTITVELFASPINSLLGVERLTTN